MNYASIEAVDKATGATEWVFRNVPIRISGTVEFLLIPRRQMLSVLCL